MLAPIVVMPSLLISSIAKSKPMDQTKRYDIIIIGGSYAGLSAAMALGRSLRDVLVIDSELPCNRQTPYSHNLITHDGSTPAQIAKQAKAQVLQYDTIRFYKGLAVDADKTMYGYSVATDKGERFSAAKLIFATGVRDIMPEIEGFAECWGISILHCPYCHGYEVRHQETGILANGDMTFHMAQLISNWTDKLTIFTNGAHELSKEQLQKIKEHNINIVEKRVSRIVHKKGKLSAIRFVDGTEQELKAIYARPQMVQHCDLPEKLGCKLNEHGLLEVSMMQQTTVEDIYACGDNASPLRSVANAIAAGNFAGAALNREMIMQTF